MKSGGENLGELKRTEFGRLPAAWATRSLVEVASKILDFRGRTPRKLGMDWGDGDIPALSAGNVKMGFIDFDEECYFGSEALYKRWMTNGHASKGDLCFTTEAPLGNVAQIPDSRKYILSQRTVLIQPNCAKTDSDYLFQFLKSDRFQAALEENATGSTAKGIKRRRLEQLQVVCPPLQEQRVIGAALSDVDALLAKLDAFIAKKRDLKQAAMQQLLTGQTRLPGFSGEWKVTRLGDVAHIKTGAKNNEDKVEDGEYPLFVRSQTVERISSYSYDCEAILVPGEGGIGSIFHYINGKFDCHQRVYKISAFSADTCGKFVFFCMKHLFHKQASRNSVKATVDSLRLPTFLEFEFGSPALKEQEAIVETLDDMDAELTALEARRDKTRALKQGMMQELLTGRIRLV